MDKSQRLIDLYLPPTEGFVLESLVATTYQVDFEFFEEELLAAALGVRSPISRMRVFRSELERRLQTTDVSVLYDLRGCERLARLSPRIDPIPIVGRKLHSKISLLMWVRHDPDGGVPDRLLRLIIGSANLTRQGFRENYECIVPVDFGGRSRSPRALLTSAIDIVRQIAAESDSPQLEHQLGSFQKQAAALDDGEFADDDPRDLVIANEVLPQIEARWAETSTLPPERLTIVSPFWPEGVTAADALLSLLERLRSPGHVEFVCRGALSATGHDWLPEFDAEVATGLKDKFTGRLFLRAALPDSGTEQSELDATEETGDETEEHELAQNVAPKKSNSDQIQRHLHAKLILMDGAHGSVLYAGSSNCTRRGLGLGGPTNWEAGFVYRLTPKQRRQLQSHLTFFGPATEVLPDKPPKTEKPTRDDDPAVPWFLSEVTAEGTKLTVSFREGVSLPDDVVILMEIPSRVNESIYWLIHRREANADPVQDITTDLVSCPRCDSNLLELPMDDTVGQILPHVFVEVRWQGHTAAFPVRFDDKATLPLLLVGRKPTEGELIEYFLFGREPGDDDGGDGPGNGGPGPKPDGPIDTRRILAYFMRRFVQAIPGIEAELQQASYSRTALDAALRGPTSPLELAERAFASLTHPPTPDEPEKTPTAVGFQLTEILAALLRSQEKIEDESLKECFVPVIGRCRELIGKLVESHPELGDGVFRMYQDRFLGGAP